MPREKDAQEKRDSFLLSLVLLSRAPCFACMHLPRRLWPATRLAYRLVIFFCPREFCDYSFLPYSLQSNSSGTSTVLRTALMLLYDSWCSSRWTPPLWSVLLSSESPSIRKEGRARDLDLQREFIPKISQNWTATQEVGELQICQSLLTSRCCLF